MKNGEKLTFLLVMFAIGSAIGKSHSRKKLIKKINEPNMGQYLNRLIEFYDSNTIDIVEDEFLSLVDFGMSPKNAFSAITNIERVNND